MIKDFFEITTNLKTIPRQGWIDKVRITSPESVADHVFSTTMMAMVFGDLLQLDTLKLLKMSLLHDLSESITGDITPEKMSKDKKIKLENKTMEDILEKLPNDLKEKYADIWNELIDNNSLESKLLHELDKLEMAFQAITYSKSFPDKSFAVFLDAANSSITNPELKKIFNSLKENNIRK